MILVYIMKKLINKLTQCIYITILFILYFPNKGIKKVQVANSETVLFTGRMINVPVGKLYINFPIDFKTRVKNKSIPLLKSPHFNFALAILKNGSEQDKRDYKQFASLLSRARDRKGFFSISPSEFIQNFEKLINIISETDYKSETMPIVVNPRIWKNDFVITDGAHRAGILAALGRAEIHCGIKLWQKNSTYI